MDKINPSYLAHTFKYWIRDTHQSLYAYKSAFTFDEHYRKRQPLDQWHIEDRFDSMICFMI